MWFIGVEVEQETSAPPPKKNLDPPLTREMFFNTRREISCLCAATKYPLFIPRVIKD